MCGGLLIGIKKAENGFVLCFGKQGCVCAHILRLALSLLALRRLLLILTCLPSRHQSHGGGHRCVACVFCPCCGLCKNAHVLCHIVSKLETSKKKPPSWAVLSLTFVRLCFLNHPTVYGSFTTITRTKLIRLISTRFRRCFI